MLGTSQCRYRTCVTVVSTWPRVFKYGRFCPFGSRKLNSVEPLAEVIRATANAVRTIRISTITTIGIDCSTLAFHDQWTVTDESVEGRECAGSSNLDSGYRTRRKWTKTHNSRNLYTRGAIKRKGRGKGACLFAYSASTTVRRKRRRWAKRLGQLSVNNVNRGYSCMRSITRSSATLSINQILRDAVWS